MQRRLQRHDQSLAFEYQRTAKPPLTSRPNECWTRQCPSPYRASQCSLEAPRSCVQCLSMIGSLQQLELYLATGGVTSIPKGREPSALGCYRVELHLSKNRLIASENSFRESPARSAM